MKVHRTLGPGFLESVYSNALCHELRTSGIQSIQEDAISVVYDGIVVGEFKADLLVENRIIVELKAIETLHPAHEVQLVNYLTATNIEVGLLINFGSSSLQFKRKHRTYRPHS
ncbi:GxxExxY protein [Sulfuriroseicoccus oceanibius]|uniref:GxxExxY protein n=2 Tax=Sulfuriroseicoccus oceanibius TaxID=2707525 RepID=A0A6B3LB21_9BACT|nr:GxxExxY protein [Sulfuriroseicoccus oceanibius]